MYSSESRVAFYKVMPSTNIPHRKGPVQIIRSCQNCVRDTRKPLDDDLDEILNFMCFDDLIIRKSIWFSPYQSIQYHMGQFEILTAALQDDNKETIFVVAQTSPSDVNFLDETLRHSISDGIRLNILEPDAQPNALPSEPYHYKTIPLLYPSCPTNTSSKGSLFGPSKLEGIIKPIMSLVSAHNGELDVQIVIVVITKDHDKRMFPGLGSVCIQMLEPFSLRDYVKNAPTNYPSTHLVKHIYYNVAQNIAILAPQLVAFLILYLEEEKGVSFENLTNHVDWFRNSSLDINLHLGFSGETRNIVEFGLLILRSFICKSEGNYAPKDFHCLTEYANPVIASIAYQGIISRAILVEHNKANMSIDTTFKPEVQVRVVRDEVISRSKLIAERLELIVPCRKPCVDIETMIGQEISRMQLSGRYFTVQEPKINTTQTQTYWAGEEDSDDEYFALNRDKDAFKTWIQLTTNPQKLNRLNLFINAIEQSMIAILDKE